MAQNDFLKKVAKVFEFCRFRFKTLFALSQAMFSVKDLILHTAVLDKKILKVSQKSF